MLEIKVTVISNFTFYLRNCNMTYALSHELNQQSLAFLNESQSGHKHAKKKKVQIAIRWL